MKKTIVIGLDGAEPSLVFDHFADDLPNLRALAASGSWGRLRSCNPPITVPAWTVMTTGLSPGRLGLYGFRNRTDYSYGELAIADSRSVRVARIWDRLSEPGKKVILLGVPQTYPPQPVNGCLVAGPLAPGNESEYTWPPELKPEIELVADGYVIDVGGFRTADRGNLLRRIREMTEKRFRVARHLLSTRPWEFFMMVEMGPDRVHHAFWRHFDEGHRLHEPGSPFRDAVRDYYVLLDRLVGELVDEFGADASVLVVSDHGARRMEGGVCINEWLIREGYLVLKDRPTDSAPLRPAMVDWPRTRAWGEGGYYGRVFLNVKGREPEGTVEPGDYEKVRGEVAEGLESLGDEEGRPIGTTALRPEDLYEECRGVPPDLMVYFGDLGWRSIASVGTGKIHMRGNDTGPDDANHSAYGVFVSNLPRQGRCGVEIAELSVQDVGAMLVQLVDLPVPGGASGKTVADAEAAGDGRSADERRRIVEHLKELGYL